MAESSFTPGPWMIATGSSWRRIMSVTGTMVCEPITQRGDNHPDLHFRNGGPDGADARLIAAAPDLYEALQGFNLKPEAIVSSQGDTITLRIPIAAIQSASAALEKARSAQTATE